MFIMMLLSFIISLASVYCVIAQWDQRVTPHECGPNSFPNWDICRNPNCHSSEPYKPVLKFKCTCYPGYVLDDDNNCVLMSECLNWFNFAADEYGDQTVQSAPTEQQMSGEERQNQNQRVMNSNLRSVKKYRGKSRNRALSNGRRRFNRWKPSGRYEVIVNATQTTVTHIIRD